MLRHLLRHTDHLERSVMMTDGNWDILWQASYLPFGEVTHDH
jgi:hypothetical protein